MGYDYEEKRDPPPRPRAPFEWDGVIEPRCETDETGVWQEVEPLRIQRLIATVQDFDERVLLVQLFIAREPQIVGEPMPLILFRETAFDARLCLPVVRAGTRVDLRLRSMADGPRVYHVELWP